MTEYVLHSAPLPVKLRRHSARVTIHSEATGITLSSPGGQQAIQAIPYSQLQAIHYRKTR